MTRGVIVAAWILAVAVVPVAGQTPDLSGTWQLDVTASRIATPPAHGGGDGGPADTLHITHAANGTLTVGDEVNAAQAWTLRPDGEGSVPVGKSDRMTVTSRWEGDRLVSQGTRRPTDDESVSALKQVHALSADGGTLTIEVTITTPAGERTNTLVYRRVG